MKVHLTDEMIRETAPADRDVILQDTEVPGLFLKVTRAGSRIFGLYYTDTTGKQRRPKIGEFGIIDTEQAREFARVILLAETRKRLGLGPD